MHWIQNSNYKNIKKHANAYFEHPTTSPRNMLLYGIPGTGKTSSILQLCREMEYEMRYISQDTIASAFGGQSEINLLNLINGNRILSVRERLESRKQYKHVIVLLDEIDAIDGYLLCMLLNCIDKQPTNMFIIGTTNLLKALDPQLTRFGRFDISIYMEPLTVNERVDYLEKKGIDINTIDLVINSSHGSVPADLNALVDLISKYSLDEALLQFKPSILRNDTDYLVSVTSPPVIIGYNSIKDQIQKYILQPFLNPSKYAKFNITPMKGALLHGPPGCSKTQFAKYIAFHLNARFFVASCAQIISPYSGESELKIRTLFNRARQVGPSVIFFDELEALVSQRGTGESFQEKMITTFLTEMDGIEANHNVLLLGATNRPDLIDKALLRPGRMEKQLFINLPSIDARLVILQHYTTYYKCNLSDTLLLDLNNHCSGFSGAQLISLIKHIVLYTIKTGMTLSSDADLLPTVKQISRGSSSQI